MLTSIDEAHLQKRASPTETWAATYGKGLFGSMNRVMNELNDIGDIEDRTMSAIRQLRHCYWCERWSEPFNLSNILKTRTYPY